MRINVLFAAFTMMVIIIVIMMSDSIWTALSISFLLVNFLLLSGKLSKKGFASINAVNWGAPVEETTTEEPPAEVDTQEESPQRPQLLPTVIERNRVRGTPAEGDQSTNLYGKDQEEYDNYISAYTECYDPPKHVIGYSCAEGDSTMDASSALMAQRRTRDKKCMDGFVTKMSNPYFMRHHYAKELDEEENKVWWSRGEY